MLFYDKRINLYWKYICRIFLVKGVFLQRLTLSGKDQHCKTCEGADTVQWWPGALP